MSKNFVFIGLFGSGKTEVAINYALKLRQDYEKVAIADVDTISPYFRTRDVVDELTLKGLKVITPPGALKHADLPIVTGAVAGYLNNPDYKTVLDVGGEENGVVVVGYLKPHLKDAEVSMVINTRRPFTSNVDGIVKTYEQLSKVAKIKIDYLINNTNLSVETTKEIILEGEKIIKEASKILNVPVKYTVIPNFLEDFETEFPKFWIKRFMKMDF
ncbi:MULTISPECIES: cobalamin biosynthesis protein CobQ [unclassified Thermosipho (in: thermotogales)]|uniref:cobalamin biosynthesis protein CobQ n=1 Tax=unclassified Thermosipho (in: thermotogales) TaxID=2676525 RepID=UPI000986309F|nr:cobalamin biosynthesis protein CobQ [Thermosipho sp. 1223]MBT1248593.1 cobalamin biosynthesis protein CobQ [Thermosipho sp. 1244]OOC47323.1 cobalamin biosynthesis protein CobQ [Thermosipho sp. 1223]